MYEEMTKTRTRTVIVEAAHGGSDCDTLTEDVICTTIMCPIDCEYSADFGEWSDCSEPCG